MKEKIEQQILTGERALFDSHDLEVRDCIFEDGESPLKESSDIAVYGSMFKWKYPLWYTKNITVEDSTWFDMARAGVWYTENVSVKNSAIDAPKNFRRCRNLTLENVSIPHADETIWYCDGVKLSHVMAKGPYFALSSNDMEVDDLTLYGDYCFDGGKNITVRNSKLLSKDAFWNTENVTVENCFISGEYLGWNAKNLTFVNCVIESLQGMCYIDHLVMKNCELINTTLAFEYSSVDAQISSGITSVLNPSSGTITADYIEELIIEEDRIDSSKTKIVAEIHNKKDQFEG